MLKILKFYTETCRPCSAMVPILDGISKETGIEIVSINALTDTNLSSIYAIKSVPTLIFLKDDTEVYRKTGLISKENLKELIEKYN